MSKLTLGLMGGALFLMFAAAQAQRPGDPPKDKYDPELAQTVGADEYGMKNYVLVVLKTGPTKVPPGPERDDMFKGHFANINRRPLYGRCRGNSGLAENGPKCRE